VLSTRSRAVLVAVLGVVAIAVAAPALPTSPASDDGGGGAGPADRDGGRPDLPVGGFGDGEATLLTAVVFGLLFLAMAAVLVANADSTVAAAVGGVVLVALLSGFLLALAQLGATPPPDPATNGTPGTGSGSGSGGAGGPGPLALVPLAALVVGLALVGGGLAVARRRGGPDAPGSGGDGGPGSGPDPDPEAVGRAAGRAAERIRSASADNEVYRCWVELTRAVAPSNPETYTPAEFADAAVAAGMEPDDVRELRRLFEDVRYGGTDPAVHEERALSVFERIEAAYAGDGGDDGRGGGDGDDRDGGRSP
jgi:hypothetical protein